MTRLRAAFVFPIAVFLLLAGVFAVYLYQVGIEGKVVSDLPSVLIDKPAPTFNLPSIDGTSEGFSNKNLIGSVSLVNVVYGSLATVVVVLLTLEAAAIILLLGAQVIAELEPVPPEPGLEPG